MNANGIIFILIFIIAGVIFSRLLRLLGNKIFGFIQTTIDLFRDIIKSFKSTK